MKRMTLGWKLGLSFGTLILLMCVLGSIAVWRMNLAARNSTDMSAALIPEIKIAQMVASDSWATRFNVHDYAVSGDPESLRKGRKGIILLKEHLVLADDLVKKFPDLIALREGSIAAKAALDAWEPMIDKMEVERTNLRTQDLALNAAAKIFVRQCVDLRNAQHHLLDAAMDDKADQAKLDLKQRLATGRVIEDIVDIGNTIRLNNFKAQNAGDMEALREAMKDFDTLGKTTAILAPMLSAKEDIDRLQNIQESADSYKAAMEQVLRIQLVIKESKEKMIAAATALADHSEIVVNVGLQRTMKTAVEGAAGLNVTVGVLLAGLVIALVVGVVVARLSTRAITDPIRAGVNALATTASEISATISELASNASETAAAVAETTITVDEIRQTAQLAADKAKTVADSAQGASSAAEAGRVATDQTMQGLNLIRDQMSSIGESITRLSEQSQAVGEIVSTVTDLAEQSNLLAVNASIEAAKAGEMGKGFAVVAREIRNLADQSKDSTKQVRGILTAVQKATGKAVQAAEHGAKGVLDHSKQADEAGRAIGILTSSVQDATRAAIQIAASSQQQLVGMEQVGRAMENIKNATTQNAEGTRQLATAAHSLQEVGARLKALVDAGRDTSPVPAAR